MSNQKSLFNNFEFNSISKEDIENKLNVLRNTRPVKAIQVQASDNSFAGRLQLIKIKVDEYLGKYKDTTEVIWSKQVFHDYISKSIQEGVIAIDTETNNSLDPLTCKIMGLCLYSPNQKAVYIPINHESYITEAKLANQLTENDIREELLRLIESKTKIVMHNGKFDIKVILNTCGVRIKCYWDTMIGSKLLNPNDDRHSLKWQYANKCDSESQSYNIETFFDSKIVKYAWVSPEVFALYAATDSYCTYLLYLYQVEKFKSEPKLFELFQELEMEVLDVVVDMEQIGITFDHDLAKKLSIKYRTKLKDIERQIKVITDDYKPQLLKFKLNNPNVRLDDPILLSSPMQLATLMYDVMKLPQIDERKTGEEVMKKINHPISKLILKYREYNKLLDAFIESLPNKANPKTRKIHANFNQMGADTGRFSSSGPNMQQIPSHCKEIRLLFKASPGYVLVGSDFSQQEPRLLAHYSHDENMINAYKEKKDLYATVAAKVHNKTYWECMEKFEDGSPNPMGKKLRGDIKSVVLGLMYGRGADAIAEQIKSTREQAQEIINSFFNGFPKTKAWVDQTYKQATKDGFVETIWGRKRYLPDIQLEPFEMIETSARPKDFNPLFDLVPITSSNQSDRNLVNYYRTLLNKARGFQDREDIKKRALADGIKIKDNNGFIAQARRQAVNTKIQGSAADMSKRAMVLIHNSKRMKEMGFRLLLAVHDELIGECPQEHQEEAASLLSQLMIQAALPDCSVPMKCDSEIIKHWYASDFSDVVLSEYKGYCKEDENSAFAQLIQEHSEISEQCLRSIVDGTFNLTQDIV